MGKFNTIACDNHREMVQDIPHRYPPPDTDMLTWDPPAARGNTKNQSSPSSLLITGVLVIVMGIVSAIAFESSGGPAEFGLVVIAIGVVLIIASPFVKQREEEQRLEMESTEELEEKRFKEEIAAAVQEKMKGMIKVRCKYCGSLNDETADKCESCGAAL